MNHKELLKEIDESIKHLILIEFVNSTQKYEDEYNIANLCHIYKGSAYNISRGIFKNPNIDI